MEDLSLHMLDILENSLVAEARRIDLRVLEDPESDTLRLEIRDDGKGMDVETLERAADPFFSTRKTRRFGLGLSMLSEAAKATGGEMEIESFPGKGTRVRAVFHCGHIDMKPLGDVPLTLLTLIVGHPEIELHYHHAIGRHVFSFSTAGEREGEPSFPPKLLQIEERLRKGLAELEEKARIDHLS